MQFFEIPNEATNQPPPIGPINLFQSDRLLRDALKPYDLGWAEDRLTAVGEIAGGPAMEWGELANRNPPSLHTHDRYGNRIDEVEFHPAWHSLMQVSVEHGIHALPWRENRPGAHLARAVMAFLMSQAEAGHGCPISMTYAAMPVLRLEPELVAAWGPKLTSCVYDRRSISLTEKHGLLCGMAMTEKQGGSDVRANVTRAEPIGSNGLDYQIFGHKWFCSAPMCDAFLVLAQTDQGLSCFWLPRWQPDGTRNRFHIQRLKDKLGNRSNASSEVEFHGAWARRIGEPGRGVPTIIGMVQHTRLDCVISSAALMRQALIQATHHVSHRSAFGKRLIDQPLMRRVIADLTLEADATVRLMLRLAHAYDRAAADPSEAAWMRIGTAVAKYWICKRMPWLILEAMECLGGNGYVETSILPRLLRESPLNAIWEGSGNVICLDLLRAISREPEAWEQLVAVLKRAEGQHRLYDLYLERLLTRIRRKADLELEARFIVEQLALVLQAALLLEQAPAAIAAAFCTTRLGGEGGRLFGAIPAQVDFDDLAEHGRLV